MKKLSKLNHTKEAVKTGGYVIVLDTGAIINPEAEAMLQALHSRSTKGLEGHLQVLQKRGPENFMSNFYVGYGHKSIGDCGTVTIFIEGVSMLLAKAVQDWPLYSGQESSTRYLDFAKQPIFNPLDTKAGQEVQEAWRSFYVYALPKVKEHLKQKFPNKNEDEKIYEKAINARAFDIMRAFLPAGCATNLAWHTNLRQAADKLLQLRHHPLYEAKSVHNALKSALQQAHSSSFNHKEYVGTEKYMETVMKDYYYHNPKTPEFKLTKDSLDKNLLQQPEVRRAFSKRPNDKTELPKWFSELGTLQFEYQLDFGSFRDLQRHRAVTQRMPLLTMSLGFEDWYLRELPGDLQKEAKRFLKLQEKAIGQLKADKYTKQYYIAMGYKTANRITGSLPALVYMAELRSGSAVHPTARKIALSIANALQKRYGKYGLKLYPDTSSHPFDTTRGHHDITLK